MKTDYSFYNMCILHRKIVVTKKSATDIEKANTSRKI